jgi:hypothetical protein
MRREIYKGVDIFIAESNGKYVFRFVESAGRSDADVTFTAPKSDSEEEALEKAKVVIDARPKNK